MMFIVVEEWIERERERERDVLRGRVDQKRRQSGERGRKREKVKSETRKEENERKEK